MTIKINQTYVAQNFKTLAIKGDQDATSISRKDVNAVDDSDLKHYLQGMWDLKGCDIKITDLQPVKEVAPSKIGLSALGETYSIDHGNGFKSTAVMLRVDKIIQLGIDLTTIFKDLPANDGYQTKDGILLGLDMYQQKALLDAITEKKPELANKLGFYNLNGSKAVHKKLKDNNVHKGNDALWFHTGDRAKGFLWGSDYPKAGIVTSIELGTIKLGDRFCNRYIDDGGWFVDQAKGFDLGAVILGIPQ